MAQQHEHIDLTTLKEVERLLTTTEFATAPPASTMSESTPNAGEQLTPLPRRR